MAVRSGAIDSSEGFSLVELLVALTLLSVVVLIMGLLMNSLRVNSEALLAGFGEYDPADDGRHLDGDLRMLLRSQPDREVAVFALDGENALAWRRLMVDDQGRELPVEVFVAHDSEDRAVFRVLRSPEGAAVTNAVWRGVSRVDWRFWDGEEWHTAWPPGERNDAVPKLVRAELARGGERIRYDMPVPAAMKLEPETP
ncbi:MAG: prepilin-type N-terminal cleavage/methylation domain-containing protein [Verrucomicrobia bacterium]|nr:prepilin-type N-terminal cleavage/methylation domain-containing protein [Verrucomicrobiota bacterium]MCH8526379.1 prepilin-type N-terminal cleavage/methylation domain-containing protein [Kiritimatiellia bacterium]